MSKTIAEQLDAAESGAEFGQVLQGLFGTLERARDDEIDGCVDCAEGTCEQSAGHTIRLT